MLSILPRLRRFPEPEATAEGDDLTMTTAALPAKPAYLLDAEARLRAAREARAEAEDARAVHLRADIAAARSESSRGSLDAAREVQRASDKVTASRAELVAARRRYAPAWRAGVEPIVSAAEADLLAALKMARAAVDTLAQVNTFAEHNGGLPRPGMAKQAGELNERLRLIEHISAD